MSDTQRVLQYFREICKIPHRSGDEAGVARYLIEAGSHLGLNTSCDACGNVILRKATGRMSNPTILQAHMDMVWESTGPSYDEAITLCEADGKLRAAGSTLGADDGIGMALILALMEDSDVQNIEGLFTVNEENGMTGAKRLDPDLLTGTRLINLDSETEGTFTVSAAGGLTVALNTSIEHRPSRFDRPKMLKLSVSGLKGGHSGLDIGSRHLNAVQVLAQWLCNCPSSDWELAELQGGTRSNAIPVYAEALIQIESDDIAEEWTHAANAIIPQLKAVEQTVCLQAETVSRDEARVFTDPCRDRLLSALTSLPHGVLRQQPEATELSCNLATVRHSGDSVEIEESLRASSQAFLDSERDTIFCVADQLSFHCSQRDSYPPWEPQGNLPLHRLFTQTYQDLFRSPCILENVHAGVECSILQERCPSIREMISVGPTIRCAHTVQEEVEITSIDKVYRLLKAVLQKYA